MSRWRLYQIFFIFFALLSAFMFITSPGSGENITTTLASLVWVFISMALFFWARRKDREAKYGKNPPADHGKKIVDDDDDE